MQMRWLGSSLSCTYSLGVFTYNISCPLLLFLMPGKRSPFLTQKPKKCQPTPFGVSVTEEVKGVIKAYPRKEIPEWKDLKSLIKENILMFLCKKY